MLILTNKLGVPKEVDGRQVFSLPREVTILREAESPKGEWPVLEVVISEGRAKVVPLPPKG